MTFINSSELGWERVACELCGADKTRLLFVGPDRLHGLPGRFNLVRCENCGLIYVNPRPVDMESYYPAQVYASHGGRNSRSHFSAAPLRALGLRRRCETVLAYRSSGRLLDVGCGDGDFLAAMREMGDWDVQGIEPSSHAVLRARQRYGLDVRVGQLDELHFPANAFDVVTMWHVLEHLPQPRAVLQEVARILRPDGVLVLVCPIADSWEAEHFGPFWSGYDVPRHLYTFSRETLGKLLLECGMHCQEISGVIEGFNSLRISTTFWLNEKMPQKIQNESLVALTVNFAAGLLYLLVKLDKARGSGVAAFYATMSAPS